MIKAKFSGDCYCLLREYKIYSMLVVWIYHRNSFICLTIPKSSSTENNWAFVMTAQLFQTKSYKSLENNKLYAKQCQYFFRRQISIIRMVNHAERLATIYVIIINKCISSQTMYHYILYLKLKNALYYFFLQERLNMEKRHS